MLNYFLFYSTSYSLKIWRIGSGDFLPPSVTTWMHFIHSNVPRRPRSNEAIREIYIWELVWIRREISVRITSLPRFFAFRDIQKFTIVHIWVFKFVNSTVRAVTEKCESRSKVYAFQDESESSCRHSISHRCNENSSKSLYVIETQKENHRFRVRIYGIIIWLFVYSSAVTGAYKIWNYYTRRGVVRGRRCSFRSERRYIQNYNIIILHSARFM